MDRFFFDIGVATMILLAGLGLKGIFDKFDRAISREEPDYDDDEPTVH